MQKARLRHPSRGALGIGMLIAVIAGFPIWGPRVQMITFAFAALTLLLVERHLVTRRKSHMGPGSAVPGVEQSSLEFRHRTRIHRDRADCGGRRRVAAHARSGTARATATAAVRADRVHGGEHDQPRTARASCSTRSARRRPAAQQSLIEEWFSPSFHDWEVLVYGAMLLSLAMLIVFNRRIRARDVALVLVTTALSLQSARHIALFVAAATPVYIDQLALATRECAPRFGACGAHRSPRAAGLECNRHCSSASRRARCSSRDSAASTSRGWCRRCELQPYSLAYAQEFPVCAAQWLAGAPEPLKIFNQYGEGGYLAYTLSSHGDKVFIFGDAALMGDPLLYTYANVETVTPSWDSIIRRFGHRHRPVRRQHAARRRDGPRGRLDQGLPGRSERRVRAHRQGLDAAPPAGAATGRRAASARSRPRQRRTRERRTSETSRPPGHRRHRAANAAPRPAGSRGSPPRPSWCWCSPCSRSATPTSGGTSRSGGSSRPAASPRTSRSASFPPRTPGSASSGCTRSRSPGLVGAGGAGLASLVMGLAAVAAVVLAALSIPRSARVTGAVARARDGDHRGWCSTAWSASPAR